MARALDARGARARTECRQRPHARGGPDRSVLAEVLAALGGRGNITGLHANSTRLVISVRDPAAVDESALGRLARAIARPAPASVHLIVGPAARAAGCTAMETLTNLTKESGRAPDAPGRPEMPARQ